MAAKPALIADIGGTNARFALVDENGMSEPMSLKVAHYHGPAEAALEYLSRVKPALAPDRGAFAVASAITGDQVDLTNSAWHFSINEVQQRLGLNSLRVINDFTAVALSVPHLSGDDLIKIGGGPGDKSAPVALLGPGTGLGVSALIPQEGGGYLALATEGGHVDLPTTSEYEDRILQQLRVRFGASVSVERVLCGPGLVNLYEAICALHGEAPNYSTPDVITARAQDGSNMRCREALDRFYAILGTVAGNLALTTGARGGVYVAGGILPRMVDDFLRSDFRKRFEAKGRFAKYNAAIPVWLIVHKNPAFAGLASLVRS